MALAVPLAMMIDSRTMIAVAVAAHWMEVRMDFDKDKRMGQVAEFGGR